MTKRIYLQGKIAPLTYLVYVKISMRKDYVRAEIFLKMREKMSSGHISIWHAFDRRFIDEMRQNMAAT